MPQVALFLTSIAVPGHTAFRSTCATRELSGFVDKAEGELSARGCTRQGKCRHGFSEPGSKDFPLAPPES